MEYFEEPENISRFQSVVSIMLGELLEAGFIDWDSDDWKWNAYSSEQYKRICEGFEERFYFREISMLPPLRWKKRLLYKLNYEIMPKYSLMYQLIEEGKLNILQDSDSYGKSREILSTFPETLLSSNSDYASSGKDDEFENITNGNVLDKLIQFQGSYKGVDELVLDELEILFVQMLTVNFNYM